MSRDSGAESLVRALGLHYMNYRQSLYLLEMSVGLSADVWS